MMNPRVICDSPPKFTILTVPVLLSGNLTMAQAQMLQKDLTQAQAGLNLLTPLHLLYLVTPPEAADAIKFSVVVLAAVVR